MPEAVEKPDNVVPFRAPASNAATRSWYSVKNAEGEGPAVVEIYDEIGIFGISARDFIEDVKAIDTESGNVEIRINSPGGDVFDAVAISTAIRRMKARTVAVVDGLAASAASLIAAAADETHMPRNSMQMIHSPLTIAIGNAAELREAAEMLDKVQAQIVQTYEDKAERTLGEAGGGAEGRESFADLVAAETWLTADEALALGLCNRVLDEVKIAACVRADTAQRFSDQEKIAPFVAEAGDEAAATEYTEPAAAAPATTDPEELSAEAAAEIRTACKLFNAESQAETFIANRASLEEVRVSLFAEIAQSDAAQETDNRIAPAAPADDGPAGPTMESIRLNALKAARGQR